MTPETVIGVDLGGTNLRAAQVAASGTIGARSQEEVDHDHTGAAFGQLVDMVDTLLGSSEHRPGEYAIGVSVTGPVDPITGWVDNPYTLPPSMQGDLVGSIRSGLDHHGRSAEQMSIVVENDANAAAIGESLFGAGRDGEVVVCVTVGTGIGVGVVVRGQLYEGAGRTHPEPGHLVIDPSGPMCYCGARGCIESMSSATALLENARSAGVVDEHGTARQVHEHAQSGDPTAIALVHASLEALGQGIRTLVAVYAPDVVVLAGNARSQDPAMLATIEQAARGYKFGPPTVKVRSAELGNWAGCIGAAALARRLEVR